MGNLTANSVCTDVVRAVAEVEGTAPTKLDFLLHDCIPVIALEELARADGGKWELSFLVPRHEVTIRSDGSILVDGQMIRPDP